MTINYKYAPPLEDFVHLPLFTVAQLSLYSWLIILSTGAAAFAPAGSMVGIGEDGVTIIEGVEAGVSRTIITGTGEMTGWIEDL